MKQAHNMTENDLQAALQIGIYAGQFMQERGIKQSAVETRLDRSKGYLSPRVKGKKIIDSHTLQAIAAEANITLPALMVELASRAAR